MATLGKFPGQFPQTRVFPDSGLNLAALYHLEANGNTSVGSDHLTANTNGGSINHNNYGVFTKCAQFITADAGSEFGGSSYRKTSNAASWNWSASGKTYMCWFKYVSTAVNPCFWGYYVPSEGLKIYANLNVSTGQVGANMTNSGSSVNISFGSNVNWVDGKDGNWHHMAFVTESASSHKLYVDGVLHDYSTTNIGTIQANNTVNVGGLDTQYGFRGMIDEMAVFSRALTAKEISNYGGGVL